MYSLFINLKERAAQALCLGAIVALGTTVSAGDVSAQDAFAVQTAFAATVENSSTVIDLEATHCDWPDGQSLDAIVAVTDEDGSYASGVVIDRNRVLTAAHAISLTHQVFIKVDNQYRPARILMVDRRDDLALLSVDTSEIAPLPVATSDPATNQSVWAVGYPRATDRATTHGHLTRNQAGSLHASASIDLGQSGGGLIFCRQGAYYLGGMLRGYGAYEREGQLIKVPNHSVSVGAATIQRFFDSVPQGTTYSAAMVTN